MTGVSDKAGLTRLQWVVQALALPTDEQVTLFPGFAYKADELALEFDEHLRSLLASEEPGSTPEQVAALGALDNYIETVSDGGENAVNWTEEALYTSPAVWQKIRRLAVVVLDVFGWEDTCPPIKRGYVYIAGRSAEESSA